MKRKNLLVAVYACAVLLPYGASAFAQPPLGALEGIDTDGVAAGWTSDPDVIGVSLDVHFYVDGPAGTGVFAGAARANQPRPDINDTYGVPGDYGFTFPIPDQFRDGQSHILYAYGIDPTVPADNAVLSGSPHPFLFQASLTSSTSASATGGSAASDTGGSATAPSPPPSLSGVSPGTITNGATVTLTFSGSDFQPGAILTFQDPIGAPGTVSATYVSPTTLQLTLAPVSLLVGTYTVAVQNPDGQMSGQQAVIVEQYPVGSLLSVAWTGQVNVRGAWYPGTLYMVQSRLGILPTGIDRALALAIQPPYATGTAIVHLVGGRNGNPSSSFGGDPSSHVTVANVHVDNRAALDAGTMVVFAEYRGSLNPGGPDPSTPPSPTDTSVFNPPLPKYGNLIPGYDTYDGSEWAHGDLEDAVAVVEFVKGGGAGPVGLSRVSVVGSSHGGSLALGVAHRVAGLARVVSIHGGSDAKFFVDHYRQPPAVRYPGRPATDTPLSFLETATGWAAPLEASEGRIWPNNREAFLQRLFQQAGGETEFLDRMPGCAAFTAPPRSTQILVVFDINDYAVPPETGRRYVRYWSGQYPGIRLLEHDVVAETGVFDPSTLHGSAQEWPWVTDYLQAGTVPAEFVGPIQASVQGLVLDASTGLPLSGATVEISERFDGCVPAYTVQGVTAADGSVRVEQAPAGFITVTVSKAGFEPQAFELMTAKGVNDFTATPVRLVPATPLPDVTPPTVTITSPVFGATVSGVVSVAVSASDDVGVTKVECRVDGILQGSDPASPYTCSWDTAGVSAGSHTIEATAYDAAGNQNVHSITVSVAGAAGAEFAVTVSPSTVSPGGTITAIWTAPAGQTASTDWLGLYAVGAPATSYLAYQYTGGGTSGTATFTAPAPFGSYEIRYLLQDGYTEAATSNPVIVGTESGGGTVIATVTVTPASVAPGATFTAAWTVTSGTTSTTDWVGLFVPGTPDSAYLEYHPVGIGSGGSVAFTAPGTPGAYEIRYLVPAAGGGYTRAATTAVTVTSPGGGGGTAGFSLTASPASILMGGQTTVSWVVPASTSPPMDFIGLFAPGTSDEEVLGGIFFPTGGSLSGSLDVTVPVYVGAGMFEFRLLRAESAGLTRKVTSNPLSVGDNVTPGAVMESPSAGALLSLVVRLQAGAFDNIGIASVRFQVDGVMIAGTATGIGDDSYVLNWDTRTVADGTHSVAAVARDAAGNQVISDPVAVRVLNDTIPPTVSITSPANGATVRRTITIMVSATDNVGVTRVEIALDGAPVSTLTAGPYQYVWDTLGVPDGARVVKATAFDAAGNSANKTATVTVKNIDTTPPTVTLTAPAGGASVSGSVTLSANAADDDIVEGVLFQVDGVDLADDTAAPYTATWNTAGLTAGATHTLSAIARDPAGNQTTATRTVTIAMPVVTLTITPASAAPFASITVSWSISGGSAGTGDWIGLYKAGAASTSYLDYRYAGSGASGSVTFTAPGTPDSYEIRYLPDNGYAAAKTASFTVTDGSTGGGGGGGGGGSSTTYTVTATPTTMTVGATLTVAWTASGTGAGSSDWVGVYPVTNPPTTNSGYLDYRYVGSGTNGTSMFTMRNPGTYEVRYLLNGGYNSTAASQPVTVQ